MSALRSYRLLFTWQIRRLKWFIPFGTVVQGLFALGIVAGYPMLFPQLDRQTILFLATGAPAISLISMGLIAVPQLVSQARADGTQDYMRSLPIRRGIYLIADMTVWLLIVLPGIVFAFAAAAVRFGLDLTISPLVVPAVLMVALTATSIGYAIASLLPQMIANVMSQVLVVFVFMFSPLNFPAERLPDWLATVHRILPIQAMGEVLRGTLAQNAFPLSASMFATLGIWCIASLAITLRILERRA
jgi:ABC-2 type transport system permease protein